MITGNYRLCLQNVDSLYKLNCFIGIVMILNLTNFFVTSRYARKDAPTHRTSWDVWASFW
jgi:hypothetical protein